MRCASVGQNLHKLKTFARAPKSRLQACTGTGTAWQAGASRSGARGARAAEALAGATGPLATLAGLGSRAARGRGGAVHGRRCGAPVALPWRGGACAFWALVCLFFCFCGRRPGRTVHWPPHMPEPSVEPLDLDTLMERLRAAAAEHGGACAPAQVLARPWSGGAAGGSSADTAALPWALAARAGGLGPFLLADEAGFVALAYRQLLARAPDAGGQAHVSERLRQHVPRTELLAELALSAEAQALRGGQPLRWEWLARLALWAVQAPLLRGPWLVRGVWRRSERWLARRLQRGPLGLAWQVATAQDAQHAALQARLARSEDDAQALRAQLQALEQHSQAQLQALEQRSQAQAAALQAEAATALQRQGAALQARLLAQERRLVALAPPDGLQAAAAAGPRQAPAMAEPPPLALAGGVQAGASAAAVDDFLAALEASFRGPADALRAQLAQDYLHYLEAARTALGTSGPCLDLGCGRGVWLELLRERGFGAQGVDLSAAAVAAAQAQGLDAQVGDALAWLQARADGSVLAVSAFHLMEHLPFALRLALVQECARVLMPGGLLILETPNPENIWVATHTFHHDPTHSQPLTPDSLAFLVTYCGLEVLEVPRLHPYPAEAGLPGEEPVVQRLNHMTCGGQDFAVVARR